MKIAFQLCHDISPSLQTLITALQYDCVRDGDVDIDAEYTHILRFDERGLSLSSNISSVGQALAASTRVDFLDGSLHHRRLTSGKSQGIAKAVGLNKMSAPTVLDATAGLGKDSFILASLGCSVTLLERSSLIHALLDDGFRRGLASPDGEVRAILGAMTLVNTDARHWFERISAGELEKPDIIYLDPMFPPRSKSARVKKDISMLQQILGIDEDFDELLNIARECARYRVVVKRPGRKNSGDTLKPSFQIEGKSAHFDVFV